MLKQLSRSLGIRSSPIVANLIRSKQVCTRGFHISLVKQNTSSKVNEITDITSGSLKVKEDAAGSDLPSTKTDKKSKLESFQPVKFEDFKGKGYIHDSIINSLHKNDFKELTPIQQKSLVPIFNTEKGLVCRAKTGTGKTLAFAVPTLQYAYKNRGKGVSTVVLVPTRDLAFQIEEEYRKLISHLKYNERPNLELIIGGQRTSFNPRRPAEIVIATPGRLEKELQTDRKLAKCFSNVTYRIYDEADRLLDVGFESVLNEIDGLLYKVRTTPKPIKSLLFSATVDEAISEFSKKHIHPEYEFLNTVTKDDLEIPENIHQQLIECTDGIDKVNVSLLELYGIMKQHNDYKVIVFLPTKTAVDWFYEYITSALDNELFELFSKPPRVFMLHGGRSVRQRSAALKGFKVAKKGILISTDVAARGIDVKDVTNVIQMFPSVEIADYIHKVGRTGRAGKKGKASLFATPAELPYVLLLKRKRKVKFQEVIQSEKLNSSNIIDQIESPLDSTKEFLATMVGYLQQLQSAHRLDYDLLVIENMELYRKLVRDDKAMLESRILSRIGKGISAHVKRRYFTRTRYQSHDDAEFDSYSDFSRSGMSQRPRSNDRSSKMTFNGRGKYGNNRNNDWSHQNKNRYNNNNNRQTERSYDSDRKSHNDWKYEKKFEHRRIRDHDE